jgi:hypothetical protein
VLPRELINTLAEVQDRWPNALIYPNACCPGRNPDVPNNALAIDLDRVWPHDCDGDIDCTGCYGWYRLVAWIDILGEIHYID